MSRRKMFNTITVMDYCFNEVRVYRNVKTENPEKWLQEHDEHWQGSTCYYMYGEDTEVKEYDKQK